MPTTPAPDLVKLLDFKSQFERAAYAILGTYDIEPLVPGATSDDIPRRVTVCMFQRGGSTGVRGLLPDGITQEYTEFEGTLVIEHTVPMEVDEETGAELLDRDHARELDRLVATTAAAFLECLHPFDTHLEWLEVMTIRPEDPDDRPEYEREVNASRLRWRIKYCIKPDAWPQAEEPDAEEPEE